MAGIFENVASDSYDNALTGIMGGTDNTRIGNVSDRLKVDASVSSGNTINIIPRNVKYAQAQLARESNVPINVWTDVYSYTGAGYFYGAMLTLESADGAEAVRWYVNVYTDSTYYLFESTGLLISDLTNNQLLLVTNVSFQGIRQDTRTTFIELSSPIKFTTKLQVQVKRISTVKKFKAGLIMICEGII